MNRTRTVTIGGTLVCAIGIGFFMQTASQDASESPVETQPVARADFKPLSAPALPMHMESLLPEDVAIVDPDVDVEVGSGIEVAVLSEDDLAFFPTDAEKPRATCTVKASAIVEAGAMVRLDVTAPCLPNERAVVHHNGMMFTAVTDDTGSMTKIVPALSEAAVLIVEFANGEGTVATTEVASLMFYDRVVLQWSGSTGFGLHAREYGADYGSDGHVWSGAAREVTAAALGDGGFITRLGEDDVFAPKIAEVYTFPTGAATRGGDVELSVEAEVTAENCGQDIEAQSIEVRSNGELHTQYLTLTVPDCSSVGDFLVLNNLVDDLKIAVN